MLSECHRRVLSRSAQQAGSILFMILISIILFAALSYAVTSAFRDGGRSPSREKVKSDAAAIINYFSLAENTVQRMVVGGVRPENIDFLSNGGSNVIGSNNSNCVTNSCRLFVQINPVPAPSSSAIRGLTYNAAVWTSSWEGKIEVDYVSVKGVGTDAPDIVMHYKGLSKEVCDEINIMSGIYSEGDSSISTSETLGTLGTDYTHATGSFPALTVNKFGSIDGRIAGRQTFCILRNASTSGYYAYHVLYPR